MWRKRRPLQLLAAKKDDGRSKYAPDTIRTAEARKALAHGDFAVAVPEFARLAARGVASAEVNLGYLYLQGHGTRKDPAEAVRWLRLASEHDYVAAYTLAVLYLRGVAVPKNVPRAIELLNRAKRLDWGCCDHEYYLLATIYGRGDLGRPDYNQAVDALQSIPPIKWTNPPPKSLPDLSLILLIPRVDRPSRMEQRAWFVHAGEAGHLEAQMALGHMYEGGVRGGPAEDFVPQDLARAYFWYSLAAAQGDPAAKQVFEWVANKIGPRDLLHARQMLEEFKQRKLKNR